MVFGLRFLVDIVFFQSLVVIFIFNFEYINFYLNVNNFYFVIKDLFSMVCFQLWFDEVDRSYFFSVFLKNETKTLSE